MENYCRILIGGQRGNGAELASAASERSDRRRRETDGHRTDRGLTVGRMLGIRTEQKMKNHFPMNSNFEGNATNIFHDAEKFNQRCRETNGQRTDRGLTVGRILGIRTEQRK